MCIIACIQGSVREVICSALREALDERVEAGDVQTCAMVVLVAEVFTLRQIATGTYHFMENCPWCQEAVAGGLHLNREWCQ